MDSKAVSSCRKSSHTFSALIPKLESPMFGLIITGKGTHTSMKVVSETTWAFVRICPPSIRTPLPDETRTLPACHGSDQSALWE